MDSITRQTAKIMEGIMDSDQKDIDTIESFIDKYQLSTLLSMIGDICLDKADHISSSYQDESLTKTWKIASNKIQSLAVKLSEFGV